MNAFQKWVKARNGVQDMLDFAACNCSTADNFQGNRCQKCHDYIYAKEKAAKHHSVLRAFKLRSETAIIILEALLILLPLALIFFW